jgi:segregation and condensation protein A
MSDFVVETGEFAGPVGKLLELIRKQELFINDISLAKVTDDYLEYVAENEESLDNKAQFVRVAATLVLAKSKSLLPDTTSDTEDEEIDELEDRLRAYRLIQERAKDLRDQFGAQPAFRYQLANQTEPKKEMFAPGNTLTTEKLVKAIANCVVELPDESLPTTEIEDTIAIKNEINRLQTRLQELREVSFTSITRSDKKHHRVVSFVAILELAKNGHISAQQEDNFGPITITADHEE